ncbi:MAG: universal stress protein [Campylobacterales bacterium]
MEQNTIIAATDFSRRAGNAAKRAALLCRQNGCRLTLVHAINLRFFERLLVGERRHQLKEDVTRKLENDFKALQAPGDILVEIGSPNEVVLDTARIRQPKLIVLGDHGEFHLKDVLLGTTARHIVEQAHLPILVVKNDNEAPYRNIFLATDFSDSSKKAIELALSLFPDAQYMLYHAYLVPGDMISSRYGFDAGEVEQMLTQMRQEALEKMDRFKADLGGALASAKSVVRASASPTEDILADSVEQKADLLVMGTRGMGSFMPLMVGSITDTLLRHSTSDMLVYKA